MKKTFNRMIGLILIFTSMVGIIFTSSSTLFIWKTHKPLTDKLTYGLDVADKTLSLNTSALITASEALTTTSNIIVEINNSLLVLAQNTNDAGPLFDTTADLLGNDLSNTLEAAKTSLESAQGSAMLIDAVLRAVTSIPFFPGDKYEPEIPLHIALADIGKNLEPIPTTLQTMSEQIRINSINLSDFETDLIGITISIKKINKNIKDSQRVIKGYKELMIQLSENITKIQSSLNTNVMRINWILTFFFAWLGFTQVGLLTQGIEILRR